MKWLHFILSHSIFIAFCAVALCYQTYVLLNLPANNLVYALVFSCTLCSYNAYWLLSKFYFSHSISFINFFKRHFSNAILFVLAFVCVITILLQMPEMIKFLVIAGVLTVLYSLPLWPVKVLKRGANLGFVKTLLLALTWTYVTIVIPAQLTFTEADLPGVLLFITRFLFMLMLCAIFDNRDSEVDKVHGLKSLATDVSRPVLKLIILGTFILYVIMGVVLRYNLHSLPQAVAFIVTGAVVLFVYFISHKKQGYLFYYFIVDGLMLFSAIATFIAANV